MKKILITLVLTFFVCGFVSAAEFEGVARILNMQIDEDSDVAYVEFVGLKIPGVSPPFIGVASGKNLVGALWECALYDQEVYLFVNVVPVPNLNIFIYKIRLFPWRKYEQKL